MDQEDVELTEEDIARAKKRNLRFRKAGKGAARTSRVMANRQAEYRKNVARGTIGKLIS